MGAFFSRIGSDPYAGYERSLEGLKSTIDRLQEKVAVRQKHISSVDGTIFTYGLAGFAIALGLAAWALRQPPGALSHKQHLCSVLPLFVEPIGAYVLYVAWNTSQSLLGRRERAKLAASNTKLRKMITDLKDTTRYQKTQALLCKYDPDYVIPSPSPPAKQQLQTPSRTPLRSIRSDGRDTPWRQSALGRMTGAGAILPAIDKLASTLIGDNPALMQMLRVAKSEAETLRERLAAAEARAAQLHAQNAALRERLGEDAGPPLMDEAGLGSSALEMTTPPVLTRLSLGHPASSDAAHTPFAERAKSISAPTTPLSRFRGPDLNQQPSPVEEGAEALRHGSGEMTDSEFTFVPHDTPHDTPTNVQEQQVPAEDS